MGTVLFTTKTWPHGYIDNHRGEVTSKPESQNLAFPEKNAINRHFRRRHDGNSDTISPLQGLPTLQYIVNTRDISFCGTPQVHHKTVVPCEPACTVTAVSPVDQFLPSLQRHLSYFSTSTSTFFLTSTSCKQQQSFNADIISMEEK